jgi:hypothetical protein
MKKIALLIPCTSRMRPEWNTMKDTFLFHYTLKTFLATCDKEHEFILYVGYDPGDRIFAETKEQQTILSFQKAFKFLKVKFIEMNAKKGHLTKMWNQLFRVAYDEGCDYFYQCGDDISFETKGWVNACIEILDKNEGIGIAGPVNNNHLIITQGFVSRMHMRIFGEFFPETILNWGCDDWYNHVYQPYFCYILTWHYCSNEGGRPRYHVNGDKNFGDGYTEKVAKLRKEVQELAKKDQDKIVRFMESDEFMNMF